MSYNKLKYIIISIVFLFVGFCVFICLESEDKKATKQQQKIEQIIEVNKQVLDAEIQEHYNDIDSLRTKRNSIESEYRNATRKELQQKIDSLFNF